MNVDFTIIILFFLLTAILYTSVGFGGGSTYLALLVAAHFEYQHIPTIALICNIVAVTNSSVIFAKHDFGSLKHVGPFLILSIPMAFIGGQIPIPKSTFLILVAISLCLAATRMLFLNPQNQQALPNRTLKKSLLIGLPVGAALGMLAGITGLGGGIFLAPVLHLTRWSNAKVIAASTSVFILLNSVAGLFGQVLKNSFVPDWTIIAPLALAVLFGSQIGARWSSMHWQAITLQRGTAALMLLISARIFWETFL